MIKYVVKRTSLVRVEDRMRVAVVAVVVVDRGSRKKRESMSNAGGVVERKKTVVKRSRPRSSVLVKGRERVCLSPIGGPRIRCMALSLPMARMARNGADEMALINPLLM